MAFSELREALDGAPDDERVLLELRRAWTGGKPGFCSPVGTPVTVSGRLTTTASVAAARRPTRQAAD
jgi:hypothetical protein